MTTPTREQECKHEHIKTWVFEDTKEPAMWSCARCGVKFAPEMATLTAGRAQAQGQLLPPEPVAAPEQQAMEL